MHALVNGLFHIQASEWLRPIGRSHLELLLPNQLFLIEWLRNANVLFLLGRKEKRFVHKNFIKNVWVFVTIFHCEMLTAWLIISIILSPSYSVTSLPFFLKFVSNLTSLTIFLKFVIWSHAGTYLLAQMQGILLLMMTKYQPAII